MQIKKSTKEIWRFSPSGLMKDPDQMP